MSLLDKISSKAGTLFVTGLATAVFGLMPQQVYSESPAISGSQYGTALENAMREGNKDRVRFLLDCMRQENEYYSEKFANDAKREAEQKARAEERKEYPHVTKVNGKYRPEEGYTWVTNKEGDFRVKLIEGEETRRDTDDATERNIEGFKEVKTGWGTFCLATCTEARDFDSDGSIDFPKDYKGVRTSFKTRDRIMLYCNGKRQRKGLGIMVINKKEGAIKYKGVMEDKCYGLNPTFDGSELGAGDFTVIFSQESKTIGSLDFKIEE